MAEKQEPVPTVSTEPIAVESIGNGLHYVQRGNLANEIVAKKSDSEAEERTKALTALTAEEEKKLIRRIDMRLIPMCALLFIMKKLDESNACSPSVLSGIVINQRTEVRY